MAHGAFHLQVTKENLGEVSEGLPVLVVCRLFIAPFATWIYWFQINFSCLHFSQHETFHCYSLGSVNPLLSSTRAAAPTTWNVCLLKAALKKRPHCELSLSDLKEPLLA